MNRASAPGYDRFKSIVTAILILILILMLLRGCAMTPLTPAPTGTSVVQPAPDTSVPSPLPATEVSTEMGTAASATPTVAPASPTPTAAALTVTPTAVATEAATNVTATPTAAGQSNGSSSCNTSVPSRLSVGQTARIVTRLNMRNDASINAALIQTNPTNTQVEIIGDPVCETVGDRAYLWWQIRLPDGTEGWSAETQLNNPSYFLEPIP
jgi:hypothetical protein